jgi:hypothetical protein
MTQSQSILLKIGARVIFNGDLADRGTVKATNAKYLAVKWDDGHESFTGHGNMKRVEPMGN